VGLEEKRAMEQGPRARQVKASFSGDFRSEKVGYGEDKC
jgi:hypothetical protein